MVLCKKCDRFTSFCGRSDSSEPRCEVHINSGLPEDSTDYRCQVAGCASITFMFDPELKAYVCSSHCQLTPSQFLNLNVDFQSSCNLPFSAITSGGTGSSDVSVLLFVVIRSSVDSRYFMTSVSSITLKKVCLQDHQM